MCSNNDVSLKWGNGRCLAAMHDFAVHACGTCNSPLQPAHSLLAGTSVSLLLLVHCVVILMPRWHDAPRARSPWQTGAPHNQLRLPSRHESMRQSLSCQLVSRQLQPCHDIGRLWHHQAQQRVTCCSVRRAAHCSLNKGCYGRGGVLTQQALRHQIGLLAVGQVVLAQVDAAPRSDMVLHGVTWQR